MNPLVDKALDAVTHSELSFCKMLSGNDTGATGAHQCGIYIPKKSTSILFSDPGIKGTNKEEWATISWNGKFLTNSRFIYYGKGTRNEYRITNFGVGFPYVKPNFIGSLFVLCKIGPTRYEAYVFEKEDDINHFLDSLGISPAETNDLIFQGKPFSGYDSYEREIMEYVRGCNGQFPSSTEMSREARAICNRSHGRTDSPDTELVDWINVEFKLFQALENEIYGSQVSQGFDSVDEFHDLALKMLNARKSRAGKSLENQLSAIFDQRKIPYSAQVRTEGNKTCDFIFPSAEAYHDADFPSNKLVTLGAKTTCKDRWRQIISEADRTRDQQKFLCTLQQGISSSQIREMEEEKVTLVVPQQYISTFPSDSRDAIWPLSKFVDYVKYLNR